MIACDVLVDRMAVVARGDATWADDESAHLEGCAACAASWRVMRAGPGIGSGVRINADAVADRLLAQLRAADQPSAHAPGAGGGGRGGRVVGRIPWRAGVGAFVAIAATLLLVFGWPVKLVEWQQGGGGTVGAVADAASADTVAVLSVLPELRALDDSELVQIRAAMQEAVDDGSTGALPRLGDLTDAELEQLLQSQGGGGGE